MQINVRPAIEDDAATASKVLCRSITECCTEDYRNDPKLIAVWVQNKTPETLRSWKANKKPSLASRSQGQ